MEAGDPWPHWPPSRFFPDSLDFAQTVSSHCTLSETLALACSLSPTELSELSLPPRSLLRLP